MMNQSALRAGVSRADITPTPGLVLQGNWGAPPSHGILRPLEVRALVIESAGRRAALATIDVIGVTRDTTARVRARVEETVGIPAAFVMLVCSHTHCAPATLPCMGLRPSRDWMARVEDEIVSGIRRAAVDLGPVTVGVGSGAAAFNVSRRPSSFAEPPDRRLRVLRVDRPDRSILATLFHYACHPTTLNGLAGLISPDYPGVARQLIDTAMGGMSLFLPGCCGDLRPATSAGNPGDPDSSAAPAHLDGYGRMLADEVCRVATSIATTASSTLSAASATIDIPFGHPLPVEQLRALSSDDSPLGRSLTGPWASDVLRLIDAHSLPRARTTEMQGMAIGPLTLVGVPGEPLQAIGRAIESSLAREFGSRTIWPVAYANDQIGYFCTARQYEEGGYEPTAYPFYGEPARFADEERVLVDGAVQLAHAVTTEREST